MEPFKTACGLVAPLDRANVDTDQIIPKQFLKSVKKVGFGKSAFFDWRYLEDGTENPKFVLNDKAFRGAKILVSGPNFGSGSSREHAPWALKEYGFIAVIAPSFADIFRNNCYQNGMLSVTLKQSDCANIMQRALAKNGYELCINLELCLVTDDFGLSATFEIDPFRKKCLLEGLDDIAVTLKQESKIDEFEKVRSYENV